MAVVPAAGDGRGRADRRRARRSAGLEPPASPVDGGAEPELCRCASRPQDHKIELGRRGATRRPEVVQRRGGRRRRAARSSIRAEESRERAAAARRSMPHGADRHDAPARRAAAPGDRRPRRDRPLPRAPRGLGAARRASRASPAGAAIQTIELAGATALARYLDQSYARRAGAAGHRQDLARRPPDRRPHRARSTRRSHGDEPQARSTTCSTRSSGPRTSAALASWRAQERRSIRTSPVRCGGPDRERRDERGCLDAGVPRSSPGRRGCSRAEAFDGTFDYLVIDEAGQLSLADALAAGTRGAEPDPARRPAAARAGLAGHPPAGHERQRARASAAGHATMPGRARLFLDRDAADAPRRLPLHLARRCTRAA